jgi:tetratricopeptide (TPR) repeat protein
MKRVLAWLAATGRRLARGFRGDASLERRTGQAAALLAAALAEDDARRRIDRLRAALSAGEELAAPAGDITVMEASLHLGEKLRALGRRDEAVALFARAVERSYRVGDPVGRQRRAGVLTRLGILDQEAGNLPRARQRYEEALRLGSDTDSSLLLGMLTQAAFNLGLLDTDAGNDEAAQKSWERAMRLGARAGHPSGWDPAAVAAFNLGHLHARRGEIVRAREAFTSVAELGEPSGTPLGLMAVAKAELALAGMAETEGLSGEPEAVHHYHRALALGRTSGLPDGALAALQSAVALGELALHASRYGECAERYREALELAAQCESGIAARFIVLSELRLGQALGESGDREDAVEHLERAFTSGRDSREEWVRELAAQAACTLHRVFCALERWPEAGELADRAETFARTIDSGTGRALAAAATYARAWQQLHAGDADGARTRLATVAEAAFESGSDVGERVGLDALLLSGHLARKAGRTEEALAQFKAVLARLRGPGTRETEGMAAMAGVNAGHCLMHLERELEARHAYEAALARGRTSGTASGRAAAANAALNLAGLLEDELPTSRRRELYSAAQTLGRASGTPLGEQCATTAARALEQLPKRD